MFPAAETRTRNEKRINKFSTKCNFARWHYLPRLMPKFILIYVASFYVYFQQSKQSLVFPTVAPNSTCGSIFFLKIRDTTNKRCHTHTRIRSIRFNSNLHFDCFVEFPTGLTSRETRDEGSDWWRDCPCFRTAKWTIIETSGSATAIIIR